MSARVGLRPRQLGEEHADGTRRAYRALRRSLEARLAPSWRSGRRMMDRAGCVDGFASVNWSSCQKGPKSISSIVALKALPGRLASAAGHEG